MPKSRANSSIHIRIRYVNPAPLAHKNRPKMCISILRKLIDPNLHDARTNVKTKDDELSLHFVCRPNADTEAPVCLHYARSVFNLVVIHYLKRDNRPNMEVM